jgi:hypothetical protein
MAAMAGEHQLDNGSPSKPKAKVTNPVDGWLPSNIFDLISLLHKCNDWTGPLALDG